MIDSLRLTVADLETLPTPLDDTRYELIDGVLYVSTQPHPGHQFAAAAITIDIGSWTRQTNPGYVLTAPGVRFSEHDAVAPDVVWIRRTDMPLHDATGKIRYAPDLVVEVLSPGMTNTRRDRNLKLKLYSQHGVKEYWLLDWRRARLDIYRPAPPKPGLVLVATLGRVDTVTSPLLPGFAARVADWCLPAPGRRPGRRRH